MSYLRLDNSEFQNASSGKTLMTADGRTRNSGLGDQLSYQFMPQRFTTYNRMYGNKRGEGQSLSQQGQTQAQPPAPTPAPHLNIRGIKQLMSAIGYPDITDSYKGGIAIWSSSTLKSRGYKFLHRVEIIDESVPSLKPVKHFSNIYIWVKIELNDNMIGNVESLSSDMYYDKGKGLLIVRSDRLDTAVAQAALIALYSKNKLSFYDIVNNEMHYTYYMDASKSKVKKALYTVLNNLSRPLRTSQSRTGRKRS
jgi:hypothetical protein